MSVPVMSEGIRSGVNWMRLNCSDIDLGQGIDDGGLGQARHPHEQPVPARQNADQQLFDDDVLADDDLGQFGAEVSVGLAQLVDGRDIIMGKSGRRGCGGACRSRGAWSFSQRLFSHKLNTP